MDVKDVLKDFGDNLITDIRYNMSDYGMGKGNLVKSLEYEIDDNSFKLYASDYWTYAQKGRGPGRVPYDFEEILEEWIVKNGIRPMNGSITQFANAIKWSTIKNGSYLYRHPEQQRDFIGDAIYVNLEQLEKSLVSVIV